MKTNKTIYPIGLAASTAKEVSSLTDDELKHEMAERRLVLESIRPYRFREMEAEYRTLTAEWQERLNVRRCDPHREKAGTTGTDA